MKAGNETASAESETLLNRQLITYLGDKRSLLRFTGQAEIYGIGKYT